MFLIIFELFLDLFLEVDYLSSSLLDKLTTLQKIPLLVAFYLNRFDE